MAGGSDIPVVPCLPGETCSLLSNGDAGASTLVECPQEKSGYSSQFTVRAIGRKEVKSLLTEKFRLPSNWADEGIRSCHGVDLG